MAKKSAPIDGKPSLHPVQWLAIGLISVAVLGAIFLYFRERQGAPTNTATQTTRPVIAVTPLQFTDFIGTVESVNEQSVAVAVMITESNGQRRAHRYTVQVDDKTSLETITISSAGTAVTPLGIKDLQKSDTVQVYDGDDNLYNRSTFTATRIIKLIST